MKKSIIVLFTLLLVVSTVSNAQISRNAAYDQINYLKRESFMASNSNQYNKVEGVPYMTKNFEDGVVYLKSGGVIQGQYRFDIYSNQMQFMEEEKLFIIAHPDSVSAIVIGDDTFVYANYQDGAKESNGYFILVQDGYYSVLLQKIKVMNKEVLGGPYQDPKTANITDGKDLFFVKDGDKPAVKVSGKKDIIKLSGEFSVQVSQYIDEEKINIKKEADLARVIKFVNSKIKGVNSDE